MGIQLRLSDILSKQLREAAERSELSIDEFAALAIAKEISRLEHSVWLSEQKREAKSRVRIEPAKPQ